MSERRHSTRREFLATGARGIAGAALLSSCSGAGSPDDGPPASRPSSIRTLGRTGLTVPIVSIGSPYAMNLVRRAFDEGMTYIHTSSSYADRNHERALGRIVGGLRRDGFAIGTSPDLPYEFSGSGPSMDPGVHVDPELIGTSMRTSLKLLGLEHVDIYYLGSVDDRRTVLHEPYIRAFEKLKQEGLTRFIGLTTHANEPEMIRAAVESGVWDVVVTSYNFRQSHRAKIEEAMAQAAEAGLGIIAMKTQAGVYWDRLRLRKINMKAALKWVVQNEHVHTTIPAFSNFDELREDLEVIRDPALTREERSDLKLGETAGLSGVFCQQCGACLPQCPARMNVPALMRASMYAAGHGQPAKARRVLRGWAAADIACAECRHCTVRCALGMEVQPAGRMMAELLEAGRLLS